MRVIPRSVIVVFAAFFLFSTASTAQDRSPGENKDDFFPFSVWYSGGKARAPMVSEITPTSREEWRRDLQQIKELGFNTVRTWVEWGRSEPRRGEYNFDNLHLLFELAEEVDLRVFIQVYVDSAPDWVGQHYPHTRFVTQSGHVVQPQSAPGYCTDNDEIADLVQGFYSEVARVASQYPSFYGWDLWSEPHVINWAIIDYVPDPQFCYCEGTQARFREWLAEKYGSLEALNQAWYRGFERWDEVEPPRFATILTYTDYTDWKTFIRDRLAADLGSRDRAVRAGGSNHVTTSHAAVSGITQSPRSGTGSPDDFFMADQVDFYGTSIYPKHNRPARHWPYWRIMSMMEFQRSANLRNGGWYLGELQAGPGTIGLWLSEPVTPEDHRVWAWSALAYGTRGINIYAYYPMSTGYESGGYGLINLDGTVTERAVRLGEIAQVVDRNQDLLISSRPVPAKVGIVYNRLTQLVGGQRGGGDNYHDHLVGYYRVLAEHNVPVEFVHVRDLDTGEVESYDLLIVPYPLMMTRSAADGLRQFVQQGGRAVAEARLAWNDERGFASEILPGLGLHEVFGVREQDAWMIEEVALQVEDTSHPAFARLNKGDALRGVGFANTVRSLSPEATVLATLDGEPAIVSSRYGAGETLFIGSFLGAGTHQATVTPDLGTTITEAVNTGMPSAGAFVMPRHNTDFILGLVDWAGIERPVETSADGRTNPPLMARLHETGSGYILYLINYNSDPTDVDVDVVVGSNGAFTLRELTTEEERTVRASDNRIRIETRVEGRGAQAWAISPAQ
jgi:beta-galactosidase